MKGIFHTLSTLFYYMALPLCGAARLDRPNDLLITVPANRLIPRDIFLPEVDISLANEAVLRRYRRAERQLNSDRQETATSGASFTASSTSRRLLDISGASSVSVSTLENDVTLALSKKNSVISENTGEEQVAPTQQSESELKSTPGSELTSELAPEDEVISGSTLKSELSEPTPESEVVSQPTPESEAVSELIPESEATPESSPGSEVTSEPTPESEVTSEPNPESEVTSELNPESDVTSEPNPESEVTSESNPESEVTSEPTPESEATSEPSPEVTSEAIPESELESGATPGSEVTSELTVESEVAPETKPKSEVASEPRPKNEEVLFTPESGKGASNEPEPSPPESEPEPVPETEPNTPSQAEGEPLGEMNVSAEASAEPGSTAKRDFFIAVLCILTVLILISNITLIVTILKNKTLRKPANAFVLSLSFADICIAIFVIPGIISGQFSEIWMLDTICKLCHYSSHLSLAAASFSLVAIALGRLRAIALPLKPKLTLKQIGVIVAIIWVLACLYGLRAPLVFIITPVLVSDDAGGLITRAICGAPSNKREVNEPLVVLDFLIVFALPAITIAVSYGGLLYFLSKNSIQNQASKTGGKNPKALRLSMLMIGIFILCHLPVQAFRLYLHSDVPIVPESFDLIRAFDIISFLNSLCDPIIYGYMNTQIRDAFFCLIGRPTQKEGIGHNKVHPAVTLSNGAGISRFTSTNGQLTTATS